MKKLFFMAALMLVAAFSLTSCGDDEPKEKTTVTATYNMTFSQDLLDACGLVLITYKAANGENKMEAITSTTWTKTVTSDKFPAEFGVMYKFSPKSESELTKEKYDLACNLSFQCKTNKGASANNSETIFNSTGVNKDKVKGMLDKYSGNSTGFKVNADGYVSQANNLKYE